jgi:hypothetical protein
MHAVPRGDQLRRRRRHVLTSIKATRERHDGAKRRVELVKR